MILDHLAQLWSVPVSGDVRSRKLKPGFHATQSLLSHLFSDPEAKEMLRRVVVALDPFVEDWQPTVLAHNDFYDDQMLLSPETGRLALVDFEETALGDPLLDVGNFLAHLSRSVAMGGPPVCAEYRQRFRAAALDRFGWEERELNLREAHALFRLAANPFQQPQVNWLQAMETGLSVADNILKGNL